MITRSRVLRRTVSILAGLIAAAGVAAMVPNTAHAAAPAASASVSADPSYFEVTATKAGFTSLAATLGCPRPWLGTGFGPVGQCSVSDGVRAQNGFFSPLTGAFNATGGPLPLYASGCFGYAGNTIRGCFPVSTAFGPVLFATQYAGGRGRWGNYSLITGAFVATGDWFPVA